MKKTLDYIFIDTCVFKSESYFKRNGGVSRLFDLAEKGWLCILMPEIAQREWLKHFKEATNLNFIKADKKVTLMGEYKEAVAFNEGLDKLISSYDSIVESSFDQQLKRAKVQILSTSYAGDTLESVVDRYFKQQKPFGSNGKNKEFPDAFILSSLEKYALENDITAIQLFTTDDDMIEYNDELFVKQEIRSYLNDFISKRIPALEAEEKRKRDEKDIARLMDYMAHNFNVFEPQVNSHVEQFLCDTSLYSYRFDGAKIANVSIKHLEVKGSVKDMEIIAVEEDVICALYFVDVDATICVNHFIDEGSVWDSEEQRYFFENFDDTDVEIASYVKLELEMDRTEMKMGQSPKISITEIDTDDLLDSIDERPKVVKTVEQIAKSIKQSESSFNAAMSSITALSDTLQKLRMPETIKGLEQISIINPSIEPTVKAIQHLQSVVPTSALDSIAKLVASQDIVSQDIK